MYAVSAHLVPVMNAPLAKALADHLHRAGCDPMGSWTPWSDAQHEVGLNRRGLIDQITRWGKASGSERVALSADNLVKVTDVVPQVLTVLATLKAFRNIDLNGNVAFQVEPDRDVESGHISVFEETATRLLCRAGARSRETMMRDKIRPPIDETKAPLAPILEKILNASASAPPHRVFVNLGDRDSAPIVRDAAALVRSSFTKTLRDGEVGSSPYSSYALDNVTGVISNKEIADLIDDENKAGHQVFSIPPHDPDRIFIDA